MKNLLEILTEKNLNISFAESLTGGRLSYMLTKRSGASQVFKGAIVAYSNEVKQKLLNVKELTINKYSVVSYEVVKEMNEGLKSIINSDIQISTTGNAGPTLQKNSEKYNAFYAISYLEKTIIKEIIFKNNNRNKNIKTTIKEITNSVNDMLKGSK